MNQQKGGKNKNESKEKLIGAESTNSMEKLQKCSIGLPAELLNELFAALPLENAFGILAGMPNWLLARNVRKMLKSVEMTMRNKWNEADCGPKLAASGEGGLVVKHNGSDNKVNCVRAISPISSFNLNLNDKKRSIAAYFEVEIVHKHTISWYGIGIGFCTKEFPLEGKWLGTEENSIGTDDKIGMWINGEFKRFENPDGGFKVEDVVGVGLIHSPANFPMKCFATWNGQLLGTFELPGNFAYLHLFPAVTLPTNGFSIRANFGQEKWRFNPFNQIWK